MRLRDRLTLTRDGTVVAESVPCYLGHEGGTDMIDGTSTGTYYRETVAALVELPEDTAALVASNPDGYEVEARGLTYRVSSVRPRYRHAQLHHVTLGLTRISGG